ncbi:MAG: UDP-glucose--hexose-1-phosphate uridylyltransferase [Luminiphilus sp.]|nr:UDP-glucose--hexose-1-phosphate uridylyltransferase [Luminiphilus sp.]
MTDSLSQRPHRRRNALTGEWVMVSPQRVQRPWQGEESPAYGSIGVTYDPDCYLCPGNTRVSGHVNAPYTTPWAFDNDFPAVGRNLCKVSAGAGAPTSGETSTLFRSEPIDGRCRVLCYHPDHNKTLANITEKEALAVVQLWASEVGTLRQSHRWVQVFENRGEMMGCSNAHPHGQIWAVDTLPNEGAKELAQQQAFFDAEEEALLEIYRAEEERLAERLVIQENHWTVLVPYWAMWPFETLLLPRRQIDHLDALTESEQLSLAQILTRLLRGYNALFDTCCPYTMGWHGAPGSGPAPHWQLHAHFYPPLLRSAGVRKHMVGYEMLSEAQRDLTPEAAAEKLRQNL